VIKFTGAAKLNDLKAKQMHIKRYINQEHHLNALFKISRSIAMKLIKNKTKFKLVKIIDY
jgi:hypothetical protein